MFAHLIVVSATAATLTVGPTRTYTTIDEAIGASEDGDLILVDPGTYTDRLLIKNDVTIRSTGSAEDTIIADGAQLSVLKTFVDLELDGFTVTTRDDAARHCIRVASGASIVLRNAIVTGCTAGDGLGGGLRFDTDSWGIVEDTVFVDNDAVDPQAARAAHLYSRADSLEIRRTQFVRGVTDNGDLGDGGAIFAESGTLTIEDSTFVDNVAGDDGGAIVLEGLAGYNPDGSFSDGVRSFVLKNTVFQGNTAGGRGGVLFARDVADLQLSGNTFCANASGQEGGAVYLRRNGGRIHNNVFVDHVAGNEGGALYLQDDAPSIENNHVLGSEVGLEGGAISAKDVPDLDLTNNLIAWTRKGAALSVVGGTVAQSGHNAFFSNADGDLEGLSDDVGNVYGDPDLRGWVDNGVCGDDDFRPRRKSPLVDSGLPSLLDDDGSPSDIGAFGGSEADPCLGVPEPLPRVCLGL